MPSPYTNTKWIDDTPSKFGKLFRLTIYLGTIGISIAAVYNIVTHIRAKDEAIVEIQFPYGSLVELTEPELFEQAYLSVNYNAELQESTQTIRVSGQIKSGDSTQAFTLTKKRPDRMLFIIDRGSYQMTIGVSGDIVWRRSRGLEHEDLFALIEGEEAEAWLEQRSFFDRTIRAFRGEGRINGIEISTWQERDCLKIGIQDANGQAVDILIDPPTMYTIAESQTLANGSIKQTIFSDYRDIDGIPLPFKMESFIDGVASNRIVLDGAALNTGVLSKLFEVPESLIEQ